MRFLTTLTKSILVLSFPLSSLSQNDSIVYKDGSVIILQINSMKGDDSPRLSLEGNFLIDMTYGEEAFLGGQVHYKNPAIFMSALSIGATSNSAGNSPYIRFDNSLFLLSKLKQYKCRINFFSETDLTNYKTDKRNIVKVYGAKLRPVKRLSLGLNIGFNLFKINENQEIKLDYYDYETTVHEFRQQRFFIGITLASFRFIDIKPISFTKFRTIQHPLTRCHKRSTFFKINSDFNFVNLSYDNKKLTSENAPQNFLNTFHVPYIYSATLQGNTTFQGAKGRVFISFKLGVEINNFYVKTAGAVIGYGIGYNFYSLNPSHSRN